MYKLRGHLVGEESIVTFTRGCADFRGSTAVFRLKGSSQNPVKIHGALDRLELFFKTASFHSDPHV